MAESREKQRSFHFLGGIEKKGKPAIQHCQRENFCIKLAVGALSSRTDQFPTLPGKKKNEIEEPYVNQLNR